VWRLGLLYFLLVVPQYGVVMWLPQIVKGFHGLNNQQVGLVSAIPYLFAAISMILVGSHSDRTGDRRLHVAVPALIGSAALMASAFLPVPWMKLTMITISAAAMWATLGPFWTLPTSVLGGTAAAGGIALINSVGNLGGYAGPATVGWIKNSTHSFVVPLAVLAGTVFLGALVALSVRRE
jgi:nitrate/nitrite transporter NarK